MLLQAPLSAGKGQCLIPHAPPGMLFASVFPVGHAQHRAVDQACSAREVGSDCVYQQDRPADTGVEATPY